MVVASGFQVSRRPGLSEWGTRTDANVRGLEEIPEDGHSVDGVLDRSDVHLTRAAPMYHLPVVAKEGDVVRPALDANDPAPLIVEFEGCRAHLVAQAAALDASGGPVRPSPAPGGMTGSYLESTPCTLSRLPTK